jgi:hypothetical protein
MDNSNRIKNDIEINATPVVLKLTYTTLRETEREQNFENIEFTIIIRIYGSFLQPAM